MSDWIHYLPVPWMALVVFGFTYLLAAIILVAVTVLATAERAKSFKAVSPGILPVLGILFGLFVAFTAAQVWADNDHAGASVSREASALRAVTLLAAGLPARAGDAFAGSRSQLCRAGRGGGMAGDGAPDRVSEGNADGAGRGPSNGRRDDATGRGPADRAA